MDTPEDIIGISYTAEVGHVTRDIGLGDIAVLPGRLRGLQPKVVEALAVSMQQQGLLQPIILRPAESTGPAAYYLVAGHHRYEAARKLKWEAIAGKILPAAKADEALLAEIDENLLRAELSPAERSAHQAARKEVYERLHPEALATKDGGPGRSKASRSQVETESAPAFIDDTAEKTGKSRATIAREAKRGREIPNVAALAGTSLDKGDELDALAKLKPSSRNRLIERAVDGEKVSAKTELKKEARDARERVLGGIQLALPSRKFGVILADPEWRFESYSRESGMDRSADNHYPTSETDAICARPVQDIAAVDCALFLWATVPMVQHAFRVMKAWGFEYKSHCIWKKDRIGTGYWFRNQHELLLVGIKGDGLPAPAGGTQFPSVIEAPVGRHSEKPNAFYEMIEVYFPTLPKIELNARRHRVGWLPWGLEALPADACPTPLNSSALATPAPNATTGWDELGIPNFLKRDPVRA
jgi:N6-adenosine-specific RNA methylase IME4